MDETHQLQPTHAEVWRAETRRADLGRYFEAARRAGVTRRVADKALDAAAGNIDDAWAALGRRARGEA